MSSIARCYKARANIISRTRKPDRLVQPAGRPVGRRHLQPRLCCSATAPPVERQPRQPLRQPEATRRRHDEERVQIDPPAHVSQPMPRDDQVDADRAQHLGPANRDEQPLARAGDGAPPVPARSAHVVPACCNVGNQAMLGKRCADLHRGNMSHIAPRRCTQHNVLRPGPYHAAQRTAHAHSAQAASLCVVATNSSSLRRAAPLATAERACAMPSPMESATFAA